MFRDNKIIFLPTLIQYLNARNHLRGVSYLHQIWFITIRQAMQLSALPFQKMKQHIFLNQLAYTHYY